MHKQYPAINQLSKWLRLLGYSSEITNVSLNSIRSEEAPLENNALKSLIDFSGYFLTRSRIFIQTYEKYLHKSQIILINSDKVEKQLKELYENEIIDFNYEKRPYRCTRCNSLVHKIVDKTDIKDKVPSKSYAFYTDYYNCSNKNCDTIYWRGSHWESIDEVLSRIKKDAKIKKDIHQN